MFVKWHDKWHDIEKCLDFRCEGTPPMYQLCVWKCWITWCATCVPLGVLESPGTLEVRFCVGVGVGGEPVGLVGAFPETLG